MAESTFALIKNGIVVNLIVADGENTAFFDTLYSESLADKAIQLTEENLIDVEKRPEIGWIFQNEKFINPNA